MFCYISSNWKGQPLISVEVVIKLISSTTTAKGLKIACVKDDNYYELGIKVSEEEMSKLNIKRYKFHGDWNYKIRPQ